MKKWMMIAVLLSAFAVGCKKKDANSGKNDTTQQEKKEELVLMTFSKGSCYGRCPAYTATIMPDGNIDFNARANTPVLGNHTLKADVAFIDEIMKRSKTVDFFNLKDRYDNEYVTDLPATSLTIELSTGAKTVVARHEVPAEITDFYNYIHEELMKLAEAKAEADGTKTTDPTAPVKRELPKAKNPRPLSDIDKH